MLILLLAYAAASLVHFVHNAEFLSDYPNMPAWLSRSGIYGAWACVTALGLGGYLLVLLGYQIAGLCVIAAYAVAGFDGFAHYGLAPFAHHSAAMHLTIWLEAGAAAALLLVTVASLRTRLKCKPR